MKISCVYKTKGSVLIMTLWVLFFLSSLAVLVGFYVRPQIELAKKLKDRAEVHYLAQAGVKRAMSTVVKGEEDKEYSTLKDSWNAEERLYKNIQFGDGILNIGTPNPKDPKNNFIYGLVDEERKININSAPPEMIQRVFEIKGGSAADEAKNIAASIVQWRGTELKPDEECPDNDYYKSLSSPYACKKKLFEILDEILLVKGMTKELWEKVKDSLTIYTAGAVNINTADRTTLQSLGLSGALVEKIIYFRQGIDGQEGTVDDNFFPSTDKIISEISKNEELTQEEQDQLAGMVTAGLFCVQSEYFRATSEGVVGGSGNSARIEFVINRNNQIRFWREE